MLGMLWGLCNAHSPVQEMSAVTASPLDASEAHDTLEEPPWEYPAAHFTLQLSSVCEVSCMPSLQGSESPPITPVPKW